MRGHPILAFALALIVLSSSVSLAQAHSPIFSSGPARIREDSRLLTRFPVIDGNDIRFSRLSTAQGLSQSRVAQIVQDNEGFLWFGTQYGLDRYDGYNFKVFVHDPARENSLSCAFVNSLLKDHDGTLWAATEGGLSRRKTVALPRSRARTACLAMAFTG